MSGCSCDGGAGGFTIARDDVDDAVGKAGFHGQLGDAEGGEWRLLGGLEDDGAAGGKGGAPFPGLHEEGEIPGDDLTDDADGLVAGVAEIGAVDGDGLAFDFVGPAGVVTVTVDDQRKVGGAAVANGLAVVEGFEHRQLVEILFDQVGELVEKAAALAGVHLAPGAGVEGLTGGADGEIDIGFIALGDVGDDLTGGGVDGFEGFPADGADPFAVDQHFGLADFDGRAVLLGIVGVGRLERGCGHGDLRERVG